MYIGSRDMQSETREHMRGGDGSVNILNLLSKEQLPSKSRLFGLVTLEKGCGIGSHEHNGESEIFYVLSGEGVLDDNGTIRPVKRGDCHVCRSGEYHAIRNESAAPLKFIAAIVLE
jgi:mannose-6-phosphate isomerase-like protein (cupin superfamily)